MTEVKFVSMPATELAQLMEKACENAVSKVLAAQGDELLTISELQKRIPGLSWHIFDKLRKKHKLKRCKRQIFSYGCESLAAI